MIINAIDKKIREAFSDAAIQYDVLTSLHKEIGRELAKKVIDNDNCASILDVGMGTGRLTKRLAFYFPDSTIIGLDFADGMINQAKNTSEGFAIIQADAAALPFKPESFSIIVSNLALQWVQELPKALAESRRVLSDGGKLYCTVFGRETFNELFSALAASWDKNDKGKELPIRRLSSRQEIDEALRRAGFTNIKLDYERIRVHFPTMMDLVRWIKDIGANALPREMFVGKDLLERAENYYEANFRERLGIYSTFEVIWVEAVK